MFWLRAVLKRAKKAYAKNEDENEHLWQIIKDLKVLKQEVSLHEFAARAAIEERDSKRELVCHLEEVREANQNCLDYLTH